jgi:type I restriction enzyme M protein
LARSTVHYADSDTNKILKTLHNKLRPAGTPVQRVEYIVELLLLRIFEVKLKQDPDFSQLRDLFKEPNDELVFSSLYSVSNDRLLPTLNEKFFPFYARILSEARKVYKTNLSQKVQDQLVLIEEVFKNSNFTNNVKSGNLHEIIGLVSEIDEDRLLKTDLLGDAIESALSETGGTKDIGLHRTPDHIRQFMVGLVKPTFKDIIFDPACGTAGFLFDSFGYVMESVSKAGKWPGPKAHKELQEYFTKYFSRKRGSMPSQEESINFYRSGISGIEYLGMIRKMAAINFYVRGLNPQNIEQGDSLAMFDPIRDGGSKSIVLANPPFGAERDQEAYSNVWEEFPREAETTILFVKLMHDALAKDGKCAVIVSEGFMTWDQISARNLRKLILASSCLKAIISLPQGVFISKGGVGPKTSILVFDKNGPTKSVWFYKVTNDGYTLGTNRRPIEGCQLVEALAIYDKYISNGNIPPETRNSYSIPAEWILQLDPRTAEQIKRETEDEYETKAEKEKARLKKKLDKQTKDGKLNSKERVRKLEQHDLIWESKRLNETAKRIEKAHLYSLNIPNHRSSLSEEQLEQWRTLLKDSNARSNCTLNERFRVLSECKQSESKSVLKSFDIQNALQLDIVRQYLSNLPKEYVEKNEWVNTLRNAIESGTNYPRCSLAQIIKPKYNRIKKEEFNGQYDIVAKISFSDGQIHIREFPETGMDLYIAEKGDLITSKINVHQGAIALSPRRLACSTHYQVYDTSSPDCNAEFLFNVLRSQEFLSQLIEYKNKGIKNEQGADFFMNFDIPFPSPDIQEQFALQIKALMASRVSINTLLKSFALDIVELTDKDLAPIGKAVIETKNGWSPKCDGGKQAVLSLSCLKHGNIDLGERKYTDATRSNMDRYYVTSGAFYYSRGNTPELVALAGIARNVEEDIVFPDLLTRVSFDESQMLPEYAVLLFNSTIGRTYFGKVPLGASPSMVKVSQKYMSAFPVPLLGDIEAQRIIITKYSSILESMRSMHQVASVIEDSIACKQNRIWG